MAASKVKAETIGRQMRREHDQSGCLCKGERGCAYRRGRLRADEERCRSCGYVSVFWTSAAAGHDNLCGEQVPA